MQKILFLGGSGFLGQQLLRSLPADIQPFAVARSLKSANRITRISPSVEVVSTQTAAKIKFDRIFNLVVDYGRGGMPLARLMQPNLLYPLELLEAVEAEVVINVATALPQEYSNYAFSKKLLEYALRYLEKRTKRRFINIHLHNMYGPGAEISELVGFVISKMLREQSVEVSDCSNSRDFIFVDDVVQALYLISAKHEELPAGSPVEIGSGEPTCLRNLIFMLRDLTGSNSEIRFGARPCNEFEPPVLAANTAPLRLLGWNPHHSLRDGLIATITAMAPLHD
jgi:nucleoside-diphosphate-sugar epimerase